MAIGNSTTIGEGTGLSACTVQQGDAAINFTLAFIEKASQEEIDRLGNEMEPETIRRLLRIVEATL